MDPGEQLSRLVFGYRVSAAISAAAEFRIADRIGDVPRSADELAAEAGAHPRTLYRLLRALAAVGVFHEHDDGRFSHSAMSERLRAGVPGSIHAWARLLGTPHIWNTWGRLADSVRTGENTFHLVHGTTVWEYRASHPRAQ